MPHSQISGFKSQLLYLSVGVSVVPSSQDDCRCLVHCLVGRKRSSAFIINNTVGMLKCLENYFVTSWVVTNPTLKYTSVMTL